MGIDMVIDDIKAQLVIDEGKSLTVYNDGDGYPTVGIGHLVVVGDHLNLGDTITEDQCQQFFVNDVGRAIEGVTMLVPHAVFVPKKIYCGLVNMCFNLGETGLSEFRRFLAAVIAQNWKTAAIEIIDSDWFDQVKMRAVRIVNIFMNEAVS